MLQAVFHSQIFKTQTSKQPNSRMDKYDCMFTQIIRYRNATKEKYLSLPCHQQCQRLYADLEAR